MELSIDVVIVRVSMDRERVSGDRGTGAGNGDAGSVCGRCFGEKSRFANPSFVGDIGGDESGVLVVVVDDEPLCGFLRTPTDDRLDVETLSADGAACMTRAAVMTKGAGGKGGTGQEERHAPG